MKQTLPVGPHLTLLSSSVVVAVLGGAAALMLAGCPASDPGAPMGAGGTSVGGRSGGGGSGGAGSGGAGSGGAGSGGTGSGGKASGGTGSGGAGSGGTASGGTGTGGAGSGGRGSGGVTGTGGTINGTGGTAGIGGAPAGSGGDSGRSGGGGNTPAGCGAPGLLFCDDFETATASMAPPAPRWSTALNGAATIAVDAATPAHSGTKSVHVKTMGAYQAFFVLAGAVTFPARTYLRVYMRLGAPMTAGHNTYFKAGAAATASSEHETRVGVMNGMLMINQPAGDRGFLSNEKYYTDGNKPGVVFAPMSWVCVELLVDPPKSEIQMWVDGNDVPDLHRTDWQQDPVAALRFGFEKYAGPDVDIWYDDIAVGPQKIGCN